ncbi:MAG: hypothetical protein KDC76_06905, partial [Bacteroidetes bacterium]|nr:hypothetical protein [Bacteroidota bacterium]
MRYFLIICSLIWVILLAGKSDKPNHRFTHTFNLKCDSISTQLEDMMQSAPSLSEYSELRRRFKEVEFLVAFMDHDFYNKKLNGAPLPKLEQNVTELKVIQSSGLQVLDELIADPDRSSDEWLSTLKKFQSSWKEFRTIYRYQS